MTSYSEITEYDRDKVVNKHWYDVILAKEQGQEALDQLIKDKPGLRDEYLMYSAVIEYALVIYEQCAIEFECLAYDLTYFFGPDNDIFYQDKGFDTFVLRFIPSEYHPHLLGRCGLHKEVWRYNKKHPYAWLKLFSYHKEPVPLVWKRLDYAKYLESNLKAEVYKALDARLTHFVSVATRSFL